MDRKIISKIVKASGVSAGEMVLIHFWERTQTRRLQTASWQLWRRWGRRPYCCSNPVL